MPHYVLLYFISYIAPGQRKTIPGGIFLWKQKAHLRAFGSGELIIINSSSNNSNNHDNAVRRIMSGDSIEVEVVVVHVVVVVVVVGKI